MLLTDLPSSSTILLMSTPIPWCWIRDFTYSFNDPQATLYFWHPSYDNYPVVGVSWIQARAFSVWRTDFMNSFLRAEGLPGVHNYRLPSEIEWEYAARGGLDLSMYPWGGPLYTQLQGLLPCELQAVTRQLYR
jgi:formylglycine-generating enzyme